MNDLRIPKDRLEKLFSATEGGELTYDDFLEWLADELDECLEVCDIQSEVIIA